MKEDIYELVIDEEKDGVFAISLVSSPAIERNWVFFSSEKELFSIVNEKQHMLIGAIMVPDKKIPRLDENNKQYSVFFTKETIKKIAHKYMLNKFQSESTLEHSVKIGGVTLVESWITEGKDKSNNYNLFYPTGTWVGIFKIENDDLWNEYIETKQVKGFSVEGLFEHVKVNMHSEDLMDKDIESLDEEEFNIVLKNIIDEINGTN